VICQPLHHKDVLYYRERVKGLELRIQAFKEQASITH